MSALPLKAQMAGPIGNVQNNPYTPRGHNDIAVKNAAAFYGGRGNGRRSGSSSSTTVKNNNNISPRKRTSSSSTGVPSSTAEPYSSLPSADSTSNLTVRHAVSDARLLEAEASAQEAQGNDGDTIRLMERALLLRLLAPHSSQQSMMTGSSVAVPSSSSRPYDAMETAEAAERLVIKCNAVAVAAFKRDDYGYALDLLQNAMRLTEPLSSSSSSLSSVAAVHSSANYLFSSTSAANQPQQHVPSPPSMVFLDFPSMRIALRGTTLNNLAVLEKRRGRLVAALDYIRKSVDNSNQQSPASFLNLSAILNEMGNASEAAQCARRAISLLERNAAQYQQQQQRGNTGNNNNNNTNANANANAVGTLGNGSGRNGGDRRATTSPMDEYNNLIAIAHHNLGAALESLDTNESIRVFEKGLTLALATVGPQSATTQTIQNHLMRLVRHRGGGGVGTLSSPLQSPAKSKERNGPLSSPRGPLFLPAVSPSGGQTPPPPSVMTRPSLLSPSSGSATAWGNNQAYFVGGLSLSPRPTTSPASVPHATTTTGGLQFGRAAGGQAPRPTPPTTAIPPSTTNSRVSTAISSSRPPLIGNATTTSRSSSGGRLAPLTMSNANNNKNNASTSSSAPRGGLMVSGGGGSGGLLVDANEVFASIAAAKRDRKQQHHQEGEEGSYYHSSNAGGVAEHRRRRGGEDDDTTRPSSVAASESAEGHRRRRDSDVSRDRSSSNRQKREEGGPTTRTRSPQDKKATANDDGGGDRTVTGATAQKELALTTSLGAYVMRYSPPFTQNNNTMLQQKPSSVLNRQNSNRLPFSSNNNNPSILSPSPPSVSSNNTFISGQQRPPLLRPTAGTLVVSHTDIVSFGFYRLSALLEVENVFEVKYVAARKIQQCYRKRLAIKETNRRRALRNFVVRQGVLRETRAAVTIQQAIRSFLSRIQERDAALHNHRQLTAERHKAAIVIQLIARKWLSRRELRRRRNYQMRYADSLQVLQNFFRKTLAKMRVARMAALKSTLTQLAVENEKKGRAATDIQRVWRSTLSVEIASKVRGERRRAREKDVAQRLHAMACVIQKMFRSFSTKKRLQAERSARERRYLAPAAEAQEEWYATLKLQTIARGIISRRVVSGPLAIKTRENRKKLLTEGHIRAATAIQCFVRRCFAKRRVACLLAIKRMLVTTIYPQIAAAILLQSVGNGFVVRRFLGEERSAIFAEEMAELAANMKRHERQLRHQREVFARAEEEHRLMIDIEEAEVRSRNLLHAFREGVEHLDWIAASQAAEVLRLTMEAVALELEELYIALEALEANELSVRESTILACEINEREGLRELEAEMRQKRLDIEMLRAKGKAVLDEEEKEQLLRRRNQEDEAASTHLPTESAITSTMKPSERSGESIDSNAALSPTALSQLVTPQQHPSKTIAEISKAFASSVGYIPNKHVSSSKIATTRDSTTEMGSKGGTTTTSARRKLANAANPPTHAVTASRSFLYNEKKGAINRKEEKTMSLDDRDDEENTQENDEDATATATNLSRLAKTSSATQLPPIQPYTYSPEEYERRKAREANAAVKIQTFVRGVWARYFYRTVVVENTRKYIDLLVERDADDDARNHAESDEEYWFSLQHGGGPEKKGDAVPSDPHAPPLNYPPSSAPHHPSTYRELSEKLLAQKYGQQFDQLKSIRSALGGDEAIANHKEMRIRREAEELAQAEAAAEAKRIAKEEERKRKKFEEEERAVTCITAFARGKLSESHALLLQRELIKTLHLEIELQELRRERDEKKRQEQMRAEQEFLEADESSSRQPIINDEEDAVATLNAQMHQEARITVALGTLSGFAKILKAKKEKISRYEAVMVRRAAAVLDEEEQEEEVSAPTPTELLISAAVKDGDVNEEAARRIQRFTRKHCGVLTKAEREAILEPLREARRQKLQKLVDEEEVVVGENDDISCSPTGANGGDAGVADDGTRSPSESLPQSSSLFPTMNAAAAAAASFIPRPPPVSSKRPTSFLPAATCTPTTEKVDENFGEDETNAKVTTPKEEQPKGVAPIQTQAGAAPMPTTTTPTPIPQLQSTQILYEHVYTSDSDSAASTIQRAFKVHNSKRVVHERREAQRKKWADISHTEDAAARRIQNSVRATVAKRQLRHELRSKKEAILLRVAEEDALFERELAEGRGHSMYDDRKHEDITSMHATTRSVAGTTEADNCCAVGDESNCGNGRSSASIAAVPSGGAASKAACVVVVRSPTPPLDIHKKGGDSDHQQHQKIEQQKDEEEGELSRPHTGASVHTAVMSSQEQRDLLVGQWTSVPITDEDLDYGDVLGLVERPRRRRSGGDGGENEGILKADRNNKIKSGSAVAVQRNKVVNSIGGDANRDIDEASDQTNMSPTSDDYSD